MERGVCKQGSTPSEANQVYCRARDCQGYDIHQPSHAQIVFEPVACHSYHGHRSDAHRGSQRHLYPGGRLEHKGRCITTQTIGYCQGDGDQYGHRGIVAHEIAQQRANDEQRYAHAKG